MELNINDSLLLVGEANFSFTLSLLNYCEPKFITTSCYESKQEAFKKYNSQLMEINLKLLEKYSIYPIFGVDACDLQNASLDKKFNRIIFMFPHVSGRSNLKKNRLLLKQFFNSAKQVLKCNLEEFDLFLNYENIQLEQECSSSIFVTLANGQGGTSFELDPLKREIKDSWCINQIAQEEGLILTSCTEFKQDKYEYYKSTGFRNQSKSFLTRSGLEHKFQLSLPLNFEFNISKLKDFFSKNEIQNSTNQLHPFVEFKHFLKDYLQLKENSNISSDLILEQREFDLKKGVKYEMNNLKYEILIFSFEKQEFKKIIEKLKILFQNKTDFIQINQNELKCSINASYFLKDLFQLDDIRLLFSNDKRIFKKSSNQTNKLVNLSFNIEPFLKEPLKWQHDISFWFNKHLFDFNQFFNCIRSTCFNLVRYVQLIDTFSKLQQQQQEDKFSNAYCFRLVYESCDKALTWNQTTQIQYLLRDNLAKLSDRIVLR